MRTAFLPFVISCAALFAGAAPEPAEPSIDDLPQLETAISFYPQRQEGYWPAALRRWRPGMYVCSADVFEGEGKERRIVASVGVLLAPGESRAASRTIDGLELQLVGSLNESRDRAIGRLVIRRNGERVLKQVSSFQLKDNSMRPRQ